MQETLAFLHSPRPGQSPAHQRFEVDRPDHVQPERLVAADRQLTAVSTEYDAVDALPRLGSSERHEFAPGGDVPNSGGAVAATGSDALRIGTEDRACHRPGVAAQDEHILCCTSATSRSRSSVTQSS
jgi:hypothetical protein